MGIRDELIDELLSGQDPATVMRQDGLLGELKQALLNRLMSRVRGFPTTLLRRQPAAGPDQHHMNQRTLPCTPFYSLWPMGIPPAQPDISCSWLVLPWGPARF